MKFFERFEQATPRVINQLWQNDYLDSEARNEALNLILSPLSLRLWIERLLLVLGTLFITAGILLFFAFNWANIQPMAKLVGLLGVIGFLVGLSSYLIGKSKVFAGNLVLSMAAFIVGVFMAVFGQIYQTGADSYTLFLTWAIMILPWVIMARFAPLWVLWLAVTTLAMVTWWELGLYPGTFKDEYLTLILSGFYLAVYIFSQVALNKGENWLDKKWIRLLLSIGVFAPITLYVFGAIEGYNIKDLNGGFWVANFIFVGMYLFVKFIKKSIEEYSVGFFCMLIIVMYLVLSSVFNYANNDTVELVFLFSAAFITALFYYGYKYFRHVTKGFEERIL